MAVNRYRPHVLVLPEDEMTRSLAVGFNDQATGQMQVLNPAGGWPHVLQVFQDKYVAYLTLYADAHIVLLIDFDDVYVNRFAQFQGAIPAAVSARVYVLGAITEAEVLLKATKCKAGVLGSSLAEECRSGVFAIWGCPQLQANQPELARLVTNVKPFLI